MTNITVPVQIDFRNDKVIGHLVVDKEQLPPLSDYVFALAVRFLDTDNGTYELMGVSIVDDANYAKYLEQRGVV